MLAWSINLFRIAGIRLALHWSFLLLLAWAAWEGARVAGWVGAGWVLGYVLVLFACVVLHELGHCFAARRYGVHVGRILLLPIGGMAEFDSIPRRPREEVAVALAGPAVNVGLILLLLAAGVWIPADWAMEAIPTSWGELGRHLLVLNLVMGCFNLAPVFPMDGGRVLRALLALRLPYVRATRIAANVAKVLAVVGVGVMLLAFESPHWLGAFLFLFIMLAGEAEYRAILRRERDERQWQELVARFYEGAPRIIVASPPVDRL